MTEDNTKTNYLITVVHTDTFTGRYDQHSEQVAASSEDKAVMLAKRRQSWPEKEHYDDEDIGVIKF